MSRTISVFIFVASLCSSLLGQTTNGQITGTIVDPSGAVVPGVQVEVTNETTAAVRTTVSDNASRPLHRGLYLEEKRTVPSSENVNFAGSANEH